MISKIKWKLRDKLQILDEHVALAVAVGKIHEKSFLPYKNYCNGERELVICAAGPSLKKYQPISGAIHIAVNRSFLYDKVDFDFIFAQDYTGINMCEQELINYRPNECVKFLAYNPIMSERTIPESLALKCDAKRFYVDYIYRDGFESKMVMDIENRVLGGMPNVGYSVFQLALYMNPSRIYMVGFDMSGNHFTKGTQSKDEEKKQGDLLNKYWENEGSRLIDKWREVKHFAEVYYPDIEIISVNPIGLKGIFTDFYQDKQE